MKSPGLLLTCKLPAIHSLEGINKTIRPAVVSDSRADQGLSLGFVHIVQEVFIGHDFFLSRFSSSLGVHGRWSH